MKANIALVGFMGVGKSTIGQALAKKLGWEFIDLDLLIEQRAGKPVPEIFRQNGEIAFRELEIEVTKEISQIKNTVIACGGGVVLNQINIDRLKQKSMVVYLAASATVILKRILNDKNKRPLLEGENLVSTIQELLRFRKPLYERAADVKIDISKLSIDSIVNKIVKEYLSKYPLVNH